MSRHVETFQETCVTRYPANDDGLLSGIEHQIKSQLSRVANDASNQYAFMLQNPVGSVEP